MHYVQCNRFSEVLASDRNDKRHLKEPIYRAAHKHTHMHCERSHQNGSKQILNVAEGVGRTKYNLNVHFCPLKKMPDIEREKKLQRDIRTLWIDFALHFFLSCCYFRPAYSFDSTNHGCVVYCAHFVGH